MKPLLFTLLLIAQLYQTGHASLLEYGGLAYEFVEWLTKRKQRA